ALLFAREGASVVVNDLGGANDGSGADAGPAQQVVDEIVAAGGKAVANTDNIATWDGAEGLVKQAVSEFGRLDVLV
ncbi:short-chain dehydrogenase, partial [Rhodococcus erythropolis]|nr:short-chain dehydrogenase [Rhodococcus erythropolis]